MLTKEGDPFGGRKKLILGFPIEISFAILIFKKKKKVQLKGNLILPFDL